MTKTIKPPRWVHDDPLESELLYNDDGSAYIPIYLVEVKLTRLDPYWGSENYKFRIFTTANGQMFADGSLELVVVYGGRTRKLTGAVTMLIPAETDFSDPALNSNFSATIKSECIKNACKAIGNAFGAALNERGTIPTQTQIVQKTAKQKPPAVKVAPDKAIQEKFNTAWEQGNSKLVIAIQAAYEIEYTGKEVVNA